MEKVKYYLKQPSTKRGLALLFSAVGVTVGPGVIEAVCAGIVIAIGAWETFRDEKKT